jgi:hypothetical protein
MTGRKAGFCAGFRAPGYFRGRPGRRMEATPGRGNGRMLVCGGILALMGALAYSVFSRDKQS